MTIGHTGLAQLRVVEAGMTTLGMSGMIRISGTYSLKYMKGQ